MATQVKKLMNRHRAQNAQFAYGSWQPQFGSKKCATQNVPPPGVTTDARDGGSHPATHADDVAKREMIAIYNSYVRVYDKCSLTKKRKSYHRKRATIMQGVNDALAGRSRGGSLVECILREQE